MVNLKETITADGTFKVPATSGEYIIHIVGVWGGATVVIHWDHDSGTTAYPNSSYTANAVTRLDIATGKFTFVVTSASGTTDLDVFIAPVAR